jgi:hypothetical protein
MDHQQGQQNQASQGIAQIHCFEPGPYAEVLVVLSEYSGFILGEAQKPEPLDQSKLGNMLKIYIENCLRKGPSPGQEAPTGATCKHLYVKGAKEGQLCNRPANYMGIEGAPKCASHKSSKPAKTGITESGPTSSGAAAGQTFSYAANANKGKTVPQTLTSIQQAIAEQTTPSQLSLFQTPNGIFYHKDSGIVFENKLYNGIQGWIAVGVLNASGGVDKMTTNHTYVCYANRWSWAPESVDDPEAEKQGHSLIVPSGTDHPLVQGSSGIIQQKISSITSNSTI